MSAGRFTFGNEGFCGPRSDPLGELIGKTDFDLFPADLAEKYRRDDEWVLATGKTLPGNRGAPDRRRGETLLVQILKLPVHDGQGRIVGPRASSGICRTASIWRMRARTDGCRARVRQRLREVEVEAGRREKPGVGPDPSG